MKENGGGIVGKKFVITAFVIYLVLGIGALGYYFYSNSEASEPTVTEVASEVEDDTQDEAEDIDIEEEEPAPVEEEPVPEEEADLPDNNEEVEADDEFHDELKDAPVEEAEEPAGDIRPGPYYRYTVKKLDLSSLNMYDDPVSKAHVLGQIEVGKTGFAIESAKRRTLIQVEDGSFAFVSNMYLTLTEVPEDEYPEELKTITLENAKELFK